MRPYAEAAVMHARQVHDLAIGLRSEDMAIVDRILDRQREHHDHTDDQLLALCYGSWFGETAVEQWGAHWVGLHEPHPPRLSVDGFLCSPVEAVAARLQGDATPLAQRWQELTQWIANRRQSACNAAAGNAAAWDELATDPRFHTDPRELQPPPDAAAAQAAIDPWLSELPLPGSRLLLLAAGGGTHSLLHAVAGFDVTVVDRSQRMLAIDQRAAQQFGLAIDIQALALQDLSPLAPESFDAVVQPVSSCYVPDLASIYRQVARVLRPRGLYIAQHKQPGSLQASGSAAGDYRIRFPAFAGLPVVREGRTDEHLEPGTTEFIHPLETLLGELCRSGFVIEDLTEPPRGDAWAAVGSPPHRACYLPPYLKVKARRR
jgi:SAM-dependent methyltransferase